MRAVLGLTARGDRRSARLHRRVRRHRRLHRSAGEDLFQRHGHAPGLRRAAHVDPDILIVDEALAVGDALFQKRCFQKMEQMRQQGGTLLFVSHDQESIRTLTTKALLLEQGQTRAYGDPSEVVLEYRRLLHKAESDYFDKQFIRQQQESAREPPIRPCTRGQWKRAAAAAAAPRSHFRRWRRRIPQAPPIRTTRSFGDFSAEMLKTEVFNDAGEASSTFYPLDKIRIRVTARANRALTHLNVGLRIRNKQGVKMYSWGMLNQDIAIWAGLAAGPSSGIASSRPAKFCVDFGIRQLAGLEFLRDPNFDCRRARPLLQRSAHAALAR